MKTPVLMIVFCRPETTKKVFEQVRLAEPERLYVSCDAPLNDEGCKKQNEVLDIFKSIDWKCELKILRQTENQGCSMGPYKAISWFFDNEEEGIILEDDILPSPEFFHFCEDMLERYRDNKRILSISGWNYFYHGIDVYYDNSYYFSRFSSSWGWATWKRAWKITDLKLDSITTESFSSKLREYGFKRNTRRYYMYIFKKIKHKFDSLKSWDYQFNFSAWHNNMIVIQSMKNLTENIGIGEGATHEMPLVITNNKWQSIYPLHHPEKVEVNTFLDSIRISEEKLYRRSFIIRILNKFIKVLKRL